MTRRFTGVGPIKGTAAPALGPQANGSWQALAGAAVPPQPSGGQSTAELRGATTAPPTRACARKPGVCSTQSERTGPPPPLSTDGRAGSAGVVIPKGDAHARV